MLRDPEVHEADHALRIEHDVRGLEVAVDDARLVDGLQALGDLDRYVEGVRGRQRPAVLDLAKVHAFDELHRR